MKKTARISALLLALSLLLSMTALAAAYTENPSKSASVAPLADGCAVCGRESPEAPMLDVMQGVLRCGACRTGGGLSLPLTEGAVQALRYILYCPPKKLYSFSLDENGLRMLDRAGEAFCAVQLERGFRTLDYYKAFLAEEE